MKRIALYVILVFTAFLQSCDNYLDIKPKGIQIPEFLDDFQRLMNAQKMMYSDEAYVSYLSDDIQLGDKSLLVGQLEQAQEHQQNLYRFANGAILSSGMSDQLWEAAYQRIYTFNVVIKNVFGCSDGSEKDKRELWAQAKVNRAFEYLTLVNMYGKHYCSETAKSDLGVPIVISEDINGSYIRNSVQEVYDFIFKDLTDALPYIPEKGANRFSATRQFLNGFMARAYLYMGNYNEAKKCAEEAFKWKVELLNLTKYAINPISNGSGRIFDPITKKSYPEIYDNEENIYARNGNNMMSLSRNVYVSEDLLNTFMLDLPEGGVDQRRLLYMSDNSFKLYNNVYKFPGKSMWVPYITVNSGFSSSELYLILAECYARLGKVEEALALIDQLRQNRIVKNKPLLRTTASAALKIVLDERRREFALQGSKRIIDLKRLNMEDAYKKDVTHTCGSESWILPANDKRYILPVPPKVLSQNPSIPVYER